MSELQRLGETPALSAAYTATTTATPQKTSQVLSRATIPNRTIRSDVPRSWDEATPQFRDCFRKCARGESLWPLFLYGEAGAGKTLGALSACDVVEGASKFTTLYDLHREVVRLAKGELTNAYGYEVFPSDFWGGWSRAKLAVLDELGARENISDTLYEAVWQLLESRKGRKPLIVISNLSPDRLAKAFDDRIASRCCEGTVVNLTGDRRLQR